jgi:hypothetical protein
MRKKISAHISFPDELDLTPYITIVYLLLSVILVHQLKQDIICVMLNFNYRIDGKNICLNVLKRKKIFIRRFRCDDHCICEVPDEEVFKSEWYVEEKILFV